MREVLFGNLGEGLLREGRDHFKRGVSVLVISHMHSVSQKSLIATFLKTRKRFLSLITS